MSLQHKRSSIAHKRPVATSLNDGQLALNLNATSPGVFFKNSSNVLTKVGPVHVGTSAPNSSPATGGSTGNSIGEQWLDTTGGTYVLKIWDGTAWRSDSGTFVDVSGDTMTGALILPSGTEAAPALGVGSSDNGLYLPATDELGVSTNGSERLRIDSSGNIGIGTPLSGPTNQLHIYDGNAANDQAELKIESFRPGIRLQDRSSSSSSAEIVGDNALIFRVSAPVDDDTALTERMRIDNAGNIGIGVTSPGSFNAKAEKLVLANGGDDVGITLDCDTDKEGSIYFADGSTGDNLRRGQIVYNHNGDSLRFATNASERMRIDSSGRLLIGTTSARTTGSGFTAFSQIESANSISGASFTITSNRNVDDLGARLNFARSKGGSVGSNTAVDNNAELGGIYFWGADGTDTNSRGAEIIAEVDGTPGSNDLPTRLTFGTTADGASSPTERMRIDNSGRLLVGHTSARGVGHGTAGAFEVEGTSATVFASIVKNSADAYGGSIALGKSRGTSVGANTAVQSGDELGSIRFAGADGTDVQTRAAQITAAVDGTPGSNDMPGRLVFSTTADGASSPTERMRIDSSGRLLVGTTTEGDGQADNLTIADSANCGVTIRSGTSSKGQIFFSDSTSGDGESIGRLVYNHSDNSMRFNTNGSERMRIDSSGRLLHGVSSSRSAAGLSPEIHVETAQGFPSMGIIANTTTAGQEPRFVLGRTRGSTTGSSTVVQDDDSLGSIQFAGADGTDLNPVAASIRAHVDGTPGSNDMPGRLLFSTTADGAGSPTERVRIDANGYVTIKKNPSNDTCRLSFNHVNSTRIEYSDTSGDLSFYTNSSARVKVGYTGGFRPVADNSQALGSSSNRWTAVYAVNGTIQTSDEREKTGITTSTLGSDFIKQLRPVSYKWNVGENIVTKAEDGETDVITPRPGERTHWGFIAQEVKQAADAAGVDFGGWILGDKDDPDSTQGLRYDQFIAPLTKALQEAIAKIETLETKVAALEAQ